MTLNLNRLKAERVAKGLTQQQLAEKLGKNRLWYAKRENGSVSLGANELLEIASVLGISRDNMVIFFTIDDPERER